MSSSSLESIIVNAKRLAQRLKSREADADRILAEAEEVNNQLETMRQVRSLVPFEMLKSTRLENSIFFFRLIFVLFCHLFAV